MMSLKERINEDMKAALRARETAKLGAIRLLLAAMKQKEVDERVQLDDAMVVAIIDKLLKQRRDSITQYDAANRKDLADAERYEAEVLSAYMPAAMPEAEIAEAIQMAIKETSAKGPADMGKLMAALKPKLAGRADMAQVSAKVKAALTA
ncbi:MAG TPA: GatB/YqeY domain-containing protein [Rhodocyclaceae bacterium]|nr:GatB/YqeY domain-containing protein [Rhodocyclaceae bacterium]